MQNLIFSLNATLPVFLTMVAGWLLLGEKISLMCIIGAVLITLGVIFAGVL